MIVSFGTAILQMKQGLQQLLDFFSQSSQANKDEVGNKT